MSTRGSNGYEGPIGLSSDQVVPKFREVVETEDFQRQRDQIIGEIQRYDEIKEGIDWAVTRGAHHFPVAFASSDVRVLKTVPLAHIPPLRVFFTFDDEKVWLRWIEIIKEDDGPSTL